VLARRGRRRHQPEPKCQASAEVIHGSRASAAPRSTAFSLRTLKVSGRASIGVVGEAALRRRDAVRHFISAKLRQKFRRLLVPPKSVVKFVESTMTMSPARWPVGGIQISALNSLLPASVKGWGRFGSTR